METLSSRCFFISGHMDLTKEEFAQHYEPLINAAHVQGASFVVGDAPGCDYMAQRLLTKLDAGVPHEERKTQVFHMLERPRHSFGSGFGSHNNVPSGRGYDLVGGFKSDDERDAAMTASSTNDIAWVRPEKSKRSSGTAKNLRRREDARKEFRRIERATWPRHIVEREWGDGGETYMRVFEPNADNPGVPVSPELLARLKRAEDALIDARCEVNRCYEKLRLMVAEEEEEETDTMVTRKDG